MKCNVGQKDKVIRILIGLVIAVIGFYFRSWWGLLAIIPLLTAYTRICPLYKILGIDTCERPAGKH